MDCDEDDIESTRAEKAGVMAILYILQTIVEVWSIQTGEIVLYCDNKEAVTLDTYPTYLQSFVRFSDKNYDLTEEIRNKKNHIPIPIHLCHLKRHQDDKRDFEYGKASQAVRRNIDMDIEAKAFLRDPPKKLTPKRTTPTYTQSTATFKIHGTAMIGDLNYHIRLHKNGPQMEVRLIRKEIVQKSMFSMIQWRGFERAIGRLKAAQKVPYAKAIHNMWPTADKIAGWYDEMETKCLQCKEEIESVDHVFSCKSQHAAVAFKQAILKLWKTLSRYKTVPIIVTHLVGILRSHRVGYNAPMETHVFLNPTIRNLTKKVYEKQLRLGTAALTKGFLVVEWETLQNYATNQDSRCQTNIEWASRVIKALWDFSKDIWDARCTVINANNKTTNRENKGLSQCYND